MGSLFGAFPLAYATILSSMYIPIMIMVMGLVFRTVSFEFRENSENKVFWNYAFGVGSFIATLGQGFALAGVIEGIHVDANGHFIGTTWDWLNWRRVNSCFNFNSRLCFNWFLLFNHESLW